MLQTAAITEAAEKAEQLGALTANVQDQSVVLSTHREWLTIVHYTGYLTASSSLCGYPHTSTQTSTQMHEWK